MSEEFCFFSHHLHHRYPHLVTHIKNEIAETIAEIQHLVTLAGPVPIKMSQFRGSRFSEPTFEWLVGNYDDPDSDEHLSEVMSWLGVHDFIADHAGSPASDDYRALIDELIPRHQMRAAATGVQFRGGPFSPARDEADELYSEYYRYQGLIALMEQSVVCKHLRDLGADYMFERYLMEPLLVIPDNKTAMLMKLTYA